MTPPFFLLGFLSMFIGVSAFAEVRTENAPFEQKIQNLTEGMVLTFPKGFELGKDIFGLATRFKRDHLGECSFSMVSDIAVRMENSLSWTIAKKDTTRVITTTYILGDGYGRLMTLSCEADTHLDLLRDLGIEVPRERPVQVDVINGNSDDALFERDENAAVAI